MSDSLKFCKIKHICKERYVFVDEEEIYYLWQFWFSPYGGELEITAYKKDSEKFVEIETNKLDELKKYLKSKLLNKTEAEIREFCQYLSFRGLSVQDSVKTKFGEDFCLFLQDEDSEFIYQDPNAKHWIIDFEKVRNNELEFLKEPKLLPFTITELGVTLTKDEKLTKDGKSITIDEFWKTVDKYKKDLIPLIQQKDKILRKIEEDLKRRYFQSLENMKSQKNISDFEIEMKFDVYDTLNGDVPIMNILCSKRMFEDDMLWSLNLYGIDLKVGRFCWYLIDSLGLRSIQKEFFFWSEIKVRNQKFFKL